MEQILCVVRQDLYRGGQSHKQIICQHCRHLGLGGEGIGHNRVHRSLGDLGDGFLLPLVCLCGKFFQAAGLINNYSGIGCYQQKNGNQHQVEDFLLNAADYQILEFLHGDSFSAPVLPTCLFHAFI